MTVVAQPNELVVSEVFGPTFQGEGPNLGRRAWFVRLGRCNLDCSWCDTPYTWDRSRYDLDLELTTRPILDLAREVRDASAPGDVVVLTGGEPLLQHRKLGVFVDALQRDVEVETNGTIAPPGEPWTDLVRWNVSPKLDHSGIPLARRFQPEALRAFAVGHLERLALKFVAQRPEDLDEVTAILHASGLDELGVIPWIMPEGRTAAEVLSTSRALAPAVLDRGWNLTTRLHVLLWDDLRGV